MNYKKTHIVAINGSPESGKDTFVEFCQAWAEYNSGVQGEISVHNHSTVTTSKEIATICGWDGLKTPEWRKILSDLKDYLTENHDLPLKEIITKAEKLNNNNVFFFQGDRTDVLFAHIREPEEIAKLDAWVGSKAMYQFSSVALKRDTELKQQSNHADQNVYEYNYEYIIDNNGTLMDLNDGAISFMEIITRDENDESQESGSDDE